LADEQLGSPAIIIIGDVLKGLLALPDLLPMSTTLQALPLNAQLAR
jgi:hypothetical protein